MRIYGNQEKSPTFQRLGQTNQRSATLVSYYKILPNSQHYRTIL